MRVKKRKLIAFELEERRVYESFGLLYDITLLKKKYNVDDAQPWG
jgi:hypothetical protein